MKNVENLVVPITMLKVNDSEQTKQLLGVITEHKCIPCEGGNDINGVYISYYDCHDGLGYTLTYDYQVLGFGMGKLLDPDLVRDKRFDGMFDVNRGRLEDVLKEYDKQYEDWNGMHELLVRIGGKFGIMI